MSKFDAKRGQVLLWNLPARTCQLRTAPVLVTKTVLILDFTMSAFPFGRYHPVIAGSIDGTDDQPHDKAVQRACDFLHMQKCESFAHEYLPLP